MSLKVPGAKGAVGYWGRAGVRCRVNQDQTLQKISALQQDQLLGGGLRVSLWQNVHPVTADDTLQPGTLECSCVKKSGEHADRRCLSCHGIGFTPGYVKFGYGTLYVASITPGLVVNGLTLNTTIKPHRWELSPGVLVGSLESPAFQFVRPQAGGLWESRSDGVIRHPDSNIDVEVSLNGGPYLSLQALTVADPYSGTIRYRVTLAQANAGIPSPDWEIVRSRFPITPVVGRQGPWILILKTVAANKLSQDPRGNIIDSSGNRFWTKPLSFFNCTVKPQMAIDAALPPGNLIRDQAFIEFIDGVQDGESPLRWSLVDFTYDDPLGYLTRQFFSSRRQQEKEYTGLVF